MRLQQGGATRSLKNLLQEARMPPWERERLPLIYCADTLAAVPGLGVASGFQAGAGKAGWIVTWQGQEWTPADAVAAPLRAAVDAGAQFPARTRAQQATQSKFPDKI